MDESDQKNKKARMEENQAIIKVEIKWNNTIYNLSMDPDDDVLIMKHKIKIETQVLPVHEMKLFLST